MINLNQYLKVLNDKCRIGFYGYKPTHVVKSLQNCKPVGDSALDFPTAPPFAAANTFTQASGGIPAVANTTIFPEIFEQLFAPLNSTRFYEETASTTGWARDFELYPRSERTYQVTAYDDVAETGTVNTNITYETRQQVRFQVFSHWGDLEVQRYAEGLIPFIAEQQKYGIDAINRYFNLSYIYGAKGMACFGLVNDPALPEAITPTPNANGETEWSKKDAVGIYNDFVKLFGQLSVQSQSWIDANSKMKFAFGSSIAAQLAKLNGLGTADVKALIKEAFPNVEFIQIPELDYQPAGLVQLKAEIAGRPAGYCKYSQKLLSFPVFIKNSTTQQKFAAGSFGTVITYPLAVAQMTGVGNSSQINAPSGTSFPKAKQTKQAKSEPEASTSGDK